MSSFTENPGSFTKGNGPCDPPAVSTGGSIKSYTQLIEAYENLSSMLAAHTASALPNDGADPHDAKEYIAAQLAHKQDILTFDDTPTTGSSNPVNSNGIAVALSEGLATKQDSLSFDTAPTAGSNNVVKSGAIYTAINNVINMLVDYQPKLLWDNVPTDGSVRSVNSSAVYNAIKVVADELTAFVTNFNVTPDYVTAQKILTTTEHLLGELHAKRVIDFTDWVSFGAPYASISTAQSVDTIGSYILGMMSLNWDNEDQGAPKSGYLSKSCRLMIKYINTNPMDAIVDAVVTYDGTSYHGALDVITSHAPNKWEDLAFHLVEGTASDGTKAVYICVSSTSFVYHPEEYATQFRCCGVNAIPVSAPGYIIPNNIAGTHVISSTACYAISNTKAVNNLVTTHVYVNKMYSTAGELALTVLEDGTVKFNKLPIVTGELDDALVSMSVLDAIVPIGSVIRWPGTTSTMPNRFHACDGAQLTYTEQLAKLAEVIGMSGNHITLPVEDQAMIRLY